MMNEIQELYFGRFGLRAEKVATEDVRIKIERIYKIDDSNIAYTFFVMDVVWAEVYREALKR